MQRKLKQFTGKRGMYIETLDTRMVAHPYTIYGQEYRDSVGKIFRIDWGAPQGGAEYFYGVIKSIRHTELPREQAMIPVEIISEEVYPEEGVIVLQARIKYDKNGRIPIDVFGLNGKEVRLDVHLSSAETLW